MQDQYKSSTNDINNAILKEIELINSRQIELQSLIADLEHANINLKQLVEQEQDKKKKGFLYSIISKNIELITRLYSSYREFEDTKQRYLKELSENNYKYERILLDRQRLEQRISESSEEVLEVFKLLAENKVNVNDTNNTTTNNTIINQSNNNDTVSIDNNINYEEEYQL